MSDAALDNVKKDRGALQRAFVDAGGKVGDGHHHNACPFCQDDTGFMLGTGKNGNAVFTCYRPGCKAGAAAGRQVGGTIVDLLMLSHGIDSKAACKMAVERYGQGSTYVPTSAPSATAAAQAGNVPARLAYDPSGGEEKRKHGKLHLDVDAAMEAAKYGISSRKKDGQPVYSNVVLAKYWKYTDERGEPQISVARFNTIKNGKAGKQFTPVHRDKNGWRVGLGDWGKPGKLCPLFNLVGITKALKAVGRI